jgi:hypothetical protein
MRKISVYTNCSDLDGLPSEHEYDIISDGDSVTEMYRSECSDWTFPKEKIITCQEDEQKGEYKFTIEKKKITLDTAEAYELFILLGLLYKNDRIEYRESTVIKSI